MTFDFIVIIVLCLKLMINWSFLYQTACNVHRGVNKPEYNGELRGTADILLFMLFRRYLNKLAQPMKNGMFELFMPNADGAGASFLW